MDPVHLEREMYMDLDHLELDLYGSGRLGTGSVWIRSTWNWIRIDPDHLELDLYGLDTDYFKLNHF